MDLTISKSEDDQRQLSLTVEVAENEVAKSMRKVAKKVARQYNIPGFRKGKAPYNVIVQQFGQEALRADAADTMVDEVFRSAIEQGEVDPYGRPALTEMEIDPAVKYTFLIPLEPTVELGDYRSLRKEIEEVDVQDEAVDEAIKELQEQHVIVAPAERPAEEGDTVVLQGIGTVPAEEEGADPEKIFDAEREEGLEIILNDMLFAKSKFQKNIIGMSAGESKDFQVKFTKKYEDDESLRGKTADFSITVLDVKSRELPDEDELPDLIGAEDIESIEELRTRLRDNLEHEAKQQAEGELYDGLVADLQKDATLVYPPALVDVEIDSMLENQKQQMSQYGLQWEDYLKMTGGSEQAMRESMRDEAAKAVERNLVMGQFIKDEQLELSDEDLEKAADERIEEMYKDTKIVDPTFLAGEDANEDDENPAMTQEDLDEQKARMKEFMTGDYGRQMLGNEILGAKLSERIKAVYMGEAPELEEVTEEAEEASEE